MFSPGRHLAAAAAVAASACAPAVATPRVMTDIAPVQSIVAAVMEGLGAPGLIVPPGASEHSYALRPSEARALEAADLVVWVAPGLTPWLVAPIDALAGDAPRLTLTEAPGVRLLNIRLGGPFEPDAHDGEHDDAGGDAQGHDQAASAGDDPLDADALDHADLAPADHVAHQDQADQTSAPDPHIWLDPRNAAAIAGAVAVKLSELDRDNAATYAANAAAFSAEMDALTAEIEARLAPLRGQPFLVFHDAYQYFEARFDLPAAGSIALSDAEPPRAPRVAQIRARMEQADIACVFAEPQFEPKLIATVIEGAPTRTGTLDPVGAGLEPGPGLYAALLHGLADGLVDCLAPKS